MTISHTADVRDNMTIQIGDQVTDLAFLRPNGDQVRLSAYPGPLLLILLRHLH